MALWNSRFRKPLAESALRFSASIDLDKRLFNEDIDGSKAHVRMLVKQKIISAADGAALLRGLEAIRKEIASGKVTIDWRGEDIHTLIEERLVQKIGERGKRLHTARSRNDQIALDERLYLRKTIARVCTSLQRLQRALLRQAERHKSTIVPGYTHLQRAQPILFAHHLLAYIAMFERDKGRFGDCLRRVNHSPLGAAAFAGSSLPIDRQEVARLLGFDGIVENSIDAVSDRDVVVEFVAACAIVMMHLSRLAEELVLWSTTEFGFAQIDDAFATGSSLMPQKKNPDMAELIRGKTGRVYAALIGLLTVMKGLPLAYNRDMQEDKIHLFEAADTTEASLKIASELIATTTFRGESFEQQLHGDLSLATDLVDWLVRKGVPFRKAHALVGQIVIKAVHRQCFLHELSLADYKAVSPLFTEEIYRILDPRTSVNMKYSAGSTSPKEVERQLKRWKKTLA
ncbi:MAG: argininosuccinate lyase [Ignavibacteria bacterium]